MNVLTSQTLVLVSPPADVRWIFATGLLSQLGDAVTSDTFLRTIVALATASLLAGTFAGAVVLGVARLLGYSWTLPRYLAARVLRRPFEDVGRWATVAVHFLLSVVVLFVVGAVFLGGSILTEIYGPTGVPLLGGGFVVVGALLLACSLAIWAVVAYGWIPATTTVADQSLETLRRQAAVVVATYVAAAAISYPIVLFAALMVLFFR